MYMMSTGGMYQYLVIGAAYYQQYCIRGLNEKIPLNEQNALDW
jgi:hypothetical protein